MTSEAAVEEVHVRLNPGPQTEAVASTADVTLFGGAAGGGKSFSTLFRFGLHAARYGNNYGAIFRREMPQVTMGGGIWEESMSMYPMWTRSPNLLRRTNGASPRHARSSSCAVCSTPRM